MNKAQRIQIKTADLDDQIAALERRLVEQRGPLPDVGGRGQGVIEKQLAFHRRRLGWLQWAGRQTVSRIRARIAELRGALTPEEWENRADDMRGVRPEAYLAICEIALLEQAAGDKAVI